MKPSGRDVAGKAVFTYSMLDAPGESAWRLAAAEGAAVVFDAQMLPGNRRYQAYPSGTDIPAFALSGADGEAVRDIIASASPGQPVRVSVRLDVEMVPNLQTALVWGTLPGASDETIYLIAHPAERPRTLVFVGLDGAIVD